MDDGVAMVMVVDDRVAMTMMVDDGGPTVMVVDRGVAVMGDGVAGRSRRAHNDGSSWRGHDDGRSCGGHDDDGGLRAGHHRAQSRAPGAKKGRHHGL